MWNQVQDALNQSMSRVIAGVANVLPGLVALILALLISSVLAWLASFLLRRFLKSIGFDETIARWGFFGPGDAWPVESPTLLISRLVFWGVVFLGLLVGVSAFDETLTSRLIGQFSAYLPNAAAAVILLIVGTAAARFLARSVLIGAVNMNVQYAHLLSLGVKWLILILFSAMALNHLGIGGRIVDEAFTILFAGIVLALALAFGLGAKDVVSRSLERQADKPSTEAEKTFHHL